MIGQQLGNYRILRQLGKGGMAGVFVGEHAVLGHEVAVKILHPQFLEDERMRQRFLNEARTVARLEHPSIVEVYDFGYTEGGSGYIVMKRLEGQSLRDRLEASPIELDTALELTRQVARALQVAHDGGVVHRDLKPDNIFLVRDPETRCGERAIVLDFGLAKHVEVEGGVARGGMAAELTGSGFVVGTPAYMSPEQCRGSDELDRRSDIYSLGVVLYRMSTGALPFDADNPGEMLGQHLFVEAPSALNVRPDLPRALDHLLMRCLAKRPDDRFASMNELIAGLALDASAAAMGTRDQATAALRKPAATSPTPAALPAPRGDDATLPASRIEPAAPPPEATDEIEAVPKRRSWLGAAIVVAVLGGVAAVAVVLWPHAQPVTAAALATDAAMADAAPPDGPDAARDALPDARADAAPPDAGQADAGPPLAGRELAEYVRQALGRGDRAGAFAACARATPREEFELHGCTIAACNVGEAVLARRYAAGVRRAPTRELITKACLRNGIDLASPW